MSNVISLRRSSQIVLAALCVGLLFAAIAQAETKTWNLSSDFPLTKLNPAPDKYGHKSVWYFSYGVLDNAANKYPKMKYFFGPAELEAACGTKEGYTWKRINSVTGGALGIGYNAGPTVEEGQDQCAPYVTLPTKNVFMHPELAGKGFAAVIRWKSKLTGTVTASGSVQLVDSYNAFSIKGISWEFDRGATRVVGPFEDLDTNQMSFGPVEVPVVKGEFLNLEVGAAPGHNGAYDTTDVSLTITSP
jgi:hypothetical protein